MGNPEFKEQRTPTGMAYGIYFDEHVVAVPFYDDKFREQADEQCELDSFTSRVIQQILSSQENMGKRSGMIALVEVQLISKNGHTSPTQVGRPIKEFDIQKQTSKGPHTIRITYLQGMNRTP